MNFEITDNQQRLQLSARDFASRELVPRAADVDHAGRIDAAVVKQLAEGGWLGMTVSETSANDFVSFALAIEELAAACSNTAVFVANNVTLAARTIAKFGTDQHKQELLARVTSGQTFVAFATIDTTDSSAVTLVAEAGADGSYVLRGDTGLATVFGEANYVIVFARTGADLTAFVVPNGVDGLTCTTLPASMGRRAASLVMFRFDGVRVEAGAVIGAVGGGADVARSALADARIGAAAEAIGIARAAYEKAVLHVKKEPPKQTNPGLLGVQAMLADMCVDLEAARLLTLRAASLADAGHASDSERSMAQLFASEMSTRVAHKAMQIHGARRAFATQGIERHYRDARMTELSDENTETQRSIIARTMLKA